MWWAAGALVIMPWRLGMNDMIFHVGTTQWQSLMGHLSFGVLLGAVSALLRPRLSRA